MKKLQILLPVLLMALFTVAQPKTITGTVTGKSDNAPVDLATVQVRNKTVLTDSSGKFTIEAAPGDNVTFTHVGMKSLTMRVTSGMQRMDVQMESGVNE